MMQVKYRVTRAGEKISHITTDSLMARAVRSLHRRTEADAQSLVEDGHVGTVEKNPHIIRGQTYFYSLGTEIAAQAVGLVVQVVRVANKPRVEIGADLAKSNGDVGKWASNHTPPASARRDDYQYRGPARKCEDFAEITVGYSDTIAGHAGIGPIEKWGGFNVMCIQSPVPVAE